MCTTLEFKTVQLKLSRFYGHGLIGLDKNGYLVNIFLISP